MVVCQWKAGGSKGTWHSEHVAEQYGGGGSSLFCVA